MDPSVSGAFRRGAVRDRAWDHPLSSQDKAWRLMSLYQQELEDLQGEVEQWQGRCAELTASSPRLQSTGCLAQGALREHPQAFGQDRPCKAICKETPGCSDRSASRLARCVKLLAFCAVLLLGVAFLAAAEVEPISCGHCALHSMPTRGHASSACSEKTESDDAIHIRESVGLKAPADVLLAAVEVTAGLVRVAPLQEIDDLPEAVSVEQEAPFYAVAGSRDKTARVEEEAWCALSAETTDEEMLVQEEMSSEEVPDDLAVIGDSTFFNAFAFATGAVSARLVVDLAR